MLLPHYQEEQSSEVLRESTEVRYSIETAAVRASDSEGANGSIHIFHVYELPRTPEAPAVLVVICQVWPDLSVDLIVRNQRSRNYPTCRLPVRVSRSLMDRNAGLLVVVGGLVAGLNSDWLSNEVRDLFSFLGPDPVLQYFGRWESSPKIGSHRLRLLRETYELVRADGRLRFWRLGAGRQREKPDFSNPMYCAFAATPFPGDDWFLLRGTLTSAVQGGDPRNTVSIGFATDFGDQGAEAIERRKTLRGQVAEIAARKPQSSADIPAPTGPSNGRQPHAFKGLEWKFEFFGSPRELADTFVKTVLDWQSVLSGLL